MMRESRSLSDWRIEECRREARKVLDRFHVENQEAIDLETFAWHLGKLKVKVGGLSGAEGRIVASPRGGVIRVRPNLNMGRRRFTIAHEIGHFVLHQRNVVDKTAQRKDFTVWTKATEEAEANHFAAELLMPEHLFAPSCRGEPNIRRLRELADAFSTSLLATSFQYWQYAREPVALVLSNGWTMQCFRPFKEGGLRIQFGEIHRDSAAGARLAGGMPDSGRMVRTPAYAWLEGFDDKPGKEIMEDSFYLDYYDRTITLLWVDDVLY